MKTDATSALFEAPGYKLTLRHTLPELQVERNNCYTSYPFRALDNVALLHIRPPLHFTVNCNKY
jgi:hypothetical protein